MAAPQQPLPSPWDTLSSSPHNDSMSLADLTSPQPSLGPEFGGAHGGGLETLFSDGRLKDKFQAEEGNGASHAVWP